MTANCRFPFAIFGSAELKIPVPDHENAGRSPRPSGIDFKQAAIGYFRSLPPERQHHLRTKPFYHLGRKLPKYRGPGLDPDTQRHFCDFANIVGALDLPAHSRVLDIGCGSGWLSEFLARFGYDVTGIDISPGLIAVSQERIAKSPYGVDYDTPLSCRFLVHDIENGPLPEKFDAAICYDALHHFGDENAAIASCAAMLRPGGMFFVLEGDRPSPGSPGEAELFDVMERYGTLEAPFEAGYLKRLLNRNGLAVIGDYLSFNGLIDRELVEPDGRVQVEFPRVNYLLCKKVVDHGDAAAIPDSRAPGLLRARLALKSAWQPTYLPNDRFALKLEIANIGDTLWLGGRYLRRGAVTLGVKLLRPDGSVVDEFHGEPPLPRAIGPGEGTEVVIDHACPAIRGEFTLKIDLVDQHVCWFEERGSVPLLLPLQVR